MTCNSQFEWDTAADLPDEEDGAICPDCHAEYSYNEACELDGVCECGGILEVEL